MNKIALPITVFVVLVLSFIAPFSIAHAATLTSAVNRNQLSTNETLTLIVTYDEQVDSSLLNVAPLEADFEVLGIQPQSSSSISVVNGRSTREASTVWTITLLPKQQGTLIIPSFSINNTASQPITIEVNSSTANNANDLPLQVRVTSSDDSVFPSEQLTVEIELSARSDIRNLSGPPLVVADAEVEQLGQQSFQRVDNGIARQIVTIRYAVFAQQPGELVIPVMTFTGTKGRRRSLLGPRGDQVIARTEQQLIEVKPPPTDNPAPWFPAEDVTISATWSTDVAALKVGEPVTRTITITARGQRASVIPPLKRPIGSPNYKSYRDQPQLDNRTSADGFIGTRIESEAIVPSAQGDIVLPALRLSWLNTETQQWQEALLPAETLSVTSPGITVPDVTTTDLSASQSGSAPTHPASVPRFWQLLAALLALICLVQCWIIVKLRSTEARPKQTVEKDNPDEKQAWAQLQKTITQDDASAVRRALLAWARSALPNQPQASIQSLSRYFDDVELNAALDELDNHLYNDGSMFDAQRLATAVTHLRSQIQHGNLRSDRTPVLAPLYSSKDSGGNQTTPTP